jgi:uroporphyrinogen decarboxylase
VLLCGPDTVRAATIRVLEGANSRPGHVFNLGHGILPDTPLASVEAMVDAVTNWHAGMATSSKEAVHTV